MVVSESTDSSFWHKYIIGADRGGGVFDMLPLRGVGPVVPVPESAVDQFAGLSCARPQSGFCGESVCSADAAEQLSWSVATFRGELGADAFPPASAFRRRMFALSRSSCSSRSPFFENRARPLPAFLYYCLPFEAPNSYCDRRPRELARACPCGCVASVGGVFWCGRGAKQGPRGMPRGCFQDARPPPPL